MSYRILITGKNSYIGTSVETWLNRSPEDFLIDTIDTRENAWKKADFSKYDVVFHVAGIAHANAKEDQRDLYYKVNTDLTIEIAKHAKSHGVKQFIFMSSAIVYTSSKLQDGLITRETEPYSKDPYGDSKIKAEEGLFPLRDDSFKVVVLRPPMIYGKGSKGNYPKLAKLASLTPIFPDYNNKRSMLHIENLSEFIKLIILNNEEGIFWPQNPEYTRTSEMVKFIANANDKEIYFTTLINPLIDLIKNHPIVNKVFGDLYYDMELSTYTKGNYQINTLKKSIYETENNKIIK
ncbi:NAD-dependent epimerase/dehydratase family protein [Aerococcaceae bacterium DSM 111022]|nr:NAD-dependent epimerase/dehydratase family protein [Aerococcaceae bacterium DSM 111022]